MAISLLRNEWKSYVVVKGPVTSMAFHVSFQMGHRFFLLFLISYHHIPFVFIFLACALFSSPLTSPQITNNLFNAVGALQKDEFFR